LHISNGDTLNKKLSARGNRLEKLLADKTAPDRMVEEIYLGALCRFPTDAEKEKMAKAFELAEEKERRQVLEDIYWAVLSSREFLFNH
jgi:hypothetical protein